MQKSPQPGEDQAEIVAHRGQQGLRESLIEQLSAIKSADEAATWAHRNIVAKNKLAADDAKIVEGRFQTRLLQLNQQETASGRTAVATAAARTPAATAPARTPDASVSDGLPDEVATQSHASAAEAVTLATQKSVAKAPKRLPTGSVGALGKPVRLRDKDHRRFVLRQACLVCGRVPSDPHHLTFTQPRALGRRVSDEFIVPLCRTHHRELHRSEKEVAWWQRLNIDPVPVALSLWQRTRSDDRTSGDARADPKSAPQAEAPDHILKGRA